VRVVESNSILALALLGAADARLNMETIDTTRGARANARQLRQEFLNGRAMPLIFIPLTLLLFLPQPWSVCGWFALPLYYARRWRALASPFPKTRANVFVLLLLIGVVIGLMTSPARLDGIASAGKLLAGVTAFYVLLDVLKTERDMWRAASVLVVIGVGLVLLLPFSVSWSIDKVYTLPAFLGWTLRPPGQGTNPNVVGGMLVPIFPLALAMLFSHRRREQILGAVALGPMMLALFVLQARGAWFALLGGFAIGAAMWRRWFLPLIPLLLLALLFASQQLGGASTLSNVLYGRIGILTGDTVLERVALWNQAVDLIRAHPFTGIGMGAYPYVAPYAPPYSAQEPGLLVPHAHNMFLQVALDTGVVGLVGFVGMWMLAYASAWRARSFGIAAPLPLALLIALAIIVLHSLGESVFWNAKAQWFLWFVYGMALALERI
jgi:putative inorganic carbon (HCO3(-)) transporter